MLHTLGYHTAVGAMPPVSTLLVVTNTTSFVVPLVFASGVMDVERMGEHYIGSDAVWQDRKYMTPYIFLHPPPPTEFELSAEGKLKRRERRLSPSKVKTPPEALIAALSNLCNRVTEHVVFPAGSVPWVPVAHPHWWNLGLNAVGTPITMVWQFRNRHSFPLSVLAVSIRCDIARWLTLHFSNKVGRTYPYQGWPSHVPRNSYGTAGRDCAHAHTQTLPCRHLHTWSHTHTLCSRPYGLR